MENPKCDICDQSLEHWSGNVMIEDVDYSRERRVCKVEVWCKRCTRERDDANYKPRYHCIWELDWLKNHSIFILASIMGDEKMEENPREWSAASIEKVVNIIALAHPSLMSSPIPL